MIGYAVAIHLWQSTLVLIPLALLAAMMKHAPARIPAALWWIALLKFLLPLQLLAPLGSMLWNLLLNAGSPAATAAPTVVTVWLYPEILQAPLDSSATLPTFVSLVFTTAWFVGVLWLSGRFLRRTWTDRVTAAVVSDDVEGRLEAALRIGGIPRSAVQLIEGATVPSVRGLLNPRIYVSVPLVMELADDELGAILIHENQHRRRRDPARSLLPRLAAILFFFYPPVRWLTRKIFETTEMACDDAVLQSGIRWQDYARSIARTLELGLFPVAAPASIHGFGSTSLKLRLDRLRMAGRYSTKSRHRLALIAAFLLVLTGSFLPFGPHPFQAVAAETQAADGFEGLERSEEPFPFVVESLPLPKVLQNLQRQSGIEILIKGPISEQNIALQSAVVTPLKDVLRAVESLGGLRFEVTGPRSMIAHPRSAPSSDGIQHAQLIEKVEPDYPEAMRVDKIDGRVILQALIGVDGFLSEIEVLRSEPDREDMKTAAIDAVEQWRYEPATKAGVPVETYFTIVIEFALK
ncbi:MAG: M56 family metallopeptidase [Acidobacteriota bacterium]|nr:M56 family metallopeptidase [Acidobacteriota bacterium]MDH3785377.1 M56 family metallopeptidase [Acidobacteriota bacterium]